MSSNQPEPQRWSDLPGSDRSAEGGAGVSLRRVKQASEPSDAALARLARGLAAAPAPRWRVARLAWRMALVALLIVATGSAVGAALHRWWWGGPLDAPRKVPGVAAQLPTRVGHGGRRLPVAPATSPPPLAPAPAPVEVRPPEAVLPSPPGAPAARPARARARFEEGNDLARVFRALRAGGDAGAALRALDEHDRRFPHGVLATEARIARAEALVSLNRRAEALPLLIGIEDSGDGLTPEARVTRGELLAEARRCEEAVRDFDAVLALDDQGATGGRALYGRARCHQAAGDPAAARRDLQQFLARHAGDRFAPAARRLLESLPP